MDIKHINELLQKGKSVKEVRETLGIPEKNIKEQLRI